MLVDDLFRVLQHLEHKLTQTLIPCIQEHLPRLITRPHDQLHDIMHIASLLPNGDTRKRFVRPFLIAGDAPDTLHRLALQLP